MDKFSDLIYNRPNYESQKEKLLQSKKLMLQSQTYEELRNTWIEMKDLMYRLDFIETIAYIRYLCGIDTAIYRPEVMIQSEENPKLTALQNECNQALLDSALLSEFQEEFGTQIVEIMRSHMMFSSSETNALQAEESQLINKYIHLIALQGRTQEMNDQYYSILDHLIKIRTQIAGHLGYSSYIEMAYRKNLRVDYGENDLVLFRNQIKKLFTPVCDEIHHSDEIYDVNTLFQTEQELV